MKVYCQLDAILEERGMSRRDLWRKLDGRVNYSQICFYARNERDPALHNALMIAEALGLEVGDIWRVIK